MIRILLCHSILASMLATCAVVFGQAPLDIGNRRELLVDHHLIDRLEGAELKLHQPRSANVIFRNERPWEGNHNFGVGVLYDNGRYYLYYRSMPGEIFGKYYAAVAVSDDGISWSRPALGLAEVSGTTDNNIVALEDDNGQLQPVSQGLDFWLDTNPQTPQSERFKLVTYQTNGGPHNPGPTSGEGAVHSATFWISEDGFRFRKKHPQPKFSSSLTNSFDGIGAYFWSEAEQQYVVYFRIGEKVPGFKRSIARAMSKDLMSWSEPVPMTFGDTVRENLYENMTSPYFRAPHLYVALATRFMEGRTGILTEQQFQQLDIAERYKQQAAIWNGHPADGVLMSTRAGSSEYDRTFMESFVRPGIGLENWVNRGNYPLRGVFQTGPTEMSFYVMRHYTQASWHIQRMTLRLDGFASLHAPYQGGEMVTHPVTFNGNQLSLNYSTSVAGHVQVEIQDTAGQAIPGFTLQDADFIIGDEIARIVTWQGNADVSKLAGRLLRLRFVMKDADVFSFRFE